MTVEVQYISINSGPDEKQFATPDEAMQWYGAQPDNPAMLTARPNYRAIVKIVRGAPTNVQYRVAEITETVIETTYEDFASASAAWIECVNKYL